MEKPIVLCIDSDLADLHNLRVEISTLLGDKCCIESATSAGEALVIVSTLQEKKGNLALVITDYLLPDLKGDELLVKIHALSPNSLTVLLAKEITVEAIGNAVNYARLYRYLAKPWYSEQLAAVVLEAVRSYFRDRKLVKQNLKVQFLNRELEDLASQQKQLMTELYAINKAYERFIPGQFLNLLGKSKMTDVELGDHVRKDMTILFCDIRNFTSMSEKMTPEDNFKFINAFLSRMEPAIIENHGFVDKYLGDGIMALFDGAADNAVMAAFSMLHQLTSYNQTRQRPDRPPLNIGIGINTGSVMLGTVGSKRRMDSTTIGNTVNLAARLEELTKIYGASLLISRETFFELENFTEYSFRLIDHTTVRGKLEPVTVYEIFDADPPELCEAKSDTKSTFESAILQFHARRYHDAGALFQACIDRNPNDRPAQAYLSRCLAESGVTQLIKKEN